MDAAPDVTRSPFARAARLAAGWSLVVLGAALLVLPGPGIPLLVAGLALLGREPRWARRLARRGRVWLRRLGRRARAPAPPG
jgi:hypothetical protein